LHDENRISNSRLGVCMRAFLGGLPDGRPANTELFKNQEKYS